MYFINIIRNNIHFLFYVHSESWNIIILAFLSYHNLEYNVIIVFKNIVGMIH